MLGSLYSIECSSTRPVLQPLPCRYSLEKLTPTLLVVLTVDHEGKGGFFFFIYFFLTETLRLVTRWQ